MVTRRTLNLAVIGAAMTTLSDCSDTAEIGQAYAEGQVESYSSELLNLVNPQAQIRQLASGFKWTEGPTWDSKRSQLYFSDIPNNRIHAWSRSSGLTTYLDVAGRNDTTPDKNAAPGTNGLWYHPSDDSLLICNQNARSLDSMDISSGRRLAIASSFHGRRFNSPNDLTRAADGTVYFTDPPYGLKDRKNFTGIQQDYFGVYRLTPDGEVSLVSKNFTRPNGIALSPDDSKLYVSQSDPLKPIIRALSLDASGLPTDECLFADFTDLLNDDSPGLPDGMVVDVAGNLFATGPGGVIIFSPDGTRLGRVFTGRATANCTFGEDGSTLFMTANDTLLSISTRTLGLAWK